MSSSSTIHRERDRYPTPAQVRALVAEDSQANARVVFDKQIDPKLRDPRNYDIDGHGRAFISFNIQVSYNDAFLQTLRTVVTQEFIDKNPGWRITHFKSHASTHDDYDDSHQDFTQITFEEDRDAAAIDADIEQQCARVRPARMTK